MFTEILRIKPVLDPASTKKMQASLSERFGSVAKKFGHGLKGVIKGSLLGISLGLLNRILNPLEELEEKIKTLLGQSGDLRDLSDRFNTGPGQIKRLQDVAGSLNVKPEELKDAMEKFADAVEQARREIADPFLARSDTSFAVKNFTGETDLAEGFLSFIKSLHAASASDRSKVERSVFGADQHGSFKRFIDTDFDTQAKKINEPSAQRLQNAIVTTANLNEKKNELGIENANKELLVTAAKLNDQMIKDMQAAEAREQKKLTDQIDSYQDLRRGANAVEDIKEGFTNLLNNVTTMLGELKQITAFIPKFTNSKMWNNWLKDRGY